MVRRSDLSPPEPEAPGRRPSPRAVSGSKPEAEPAGQPDLADLPVAGLTRRRLLMVATFLAVSWLAIAFVRQVGDVTAASARTDALEASNQQLAADIAALDGELRLIQRQEYIVQQARAYRLGSPLEVPFSLQQPAPGLGPDAPGSAAVRLGADIERRTPLDAWLALLFGPQP